MSTTDFFRARLDTMIDLVHPLAVLAVLAGRMPWAEIEASLAPLLAHKDRAGRPGGGRQGSIRTQRRVGRRGGEPTGLAARTDPADDVAAVPQARVQRE